MNILDLCMISYDSWVFYFKIIYWQQVGDFLAESASIQASTTATVADGYCPIRLLPIEGITFAIYHSSNNSNVVRQVRQDKCAMEWDEIIMQ
ncbi:hypothetical protein BLOT_011290 [Blomia tropicalis]|nr:hypothetical protein BLOT_011290 [Blomia tropicalis]